VEYTLTDCPIFRDHLKERRAPGGMNAVEAVERYRIGGGGNGRCGAIANTMLVCKQSAI
jgi:hypothetical protein